MSSSKSDKQRGTVSAVIPTFNRCAYIRRAIDSVLAQSVPVDEVIVIDDGSTDGTAEAVSRWYGSNVRIVRQENGGVSAARCQGVKEARCEWIAFLDSDDEWTPQRNEQLLAAAKHVPWDVAWIFGDLRIVTDAVQEHLFGKHGLSVTAYPEIFSDSFAVQFPFQFCMLQGSLIRRDVLVECGGFKEGLQHSEDVLVGFQVACRYRFAAIPSVVGIYYRTSDLNATSAMWRGVWGRDYFRARLLAFAAAIESGRKKPWNKVYAEEVRGYCKMLAAAGDLPRMLALQQFRFGGVSLKGIAFLCAAMAGCRGVQAWKAVSDYRNHRKGAALRECKPTSQASGVRSLSA